MERRRFGLLGKKLEHSFSPNYFALKFEQEGLPNCTYELFPLTKINDFEQLIQEQAHLAGLNVTIPYKQAIIPYLDELSPQAKAVGAVNTIQFWGNKLIGHNTDVYGFEQSLLSCLTPLQKQSKALILGTGGAALAVAYVLQQLQIPYQYVSRTPTTGQLTYTAINAPLLKQHLILVNTTPLGMFPHIHSYPDIDYNALTSDHLLFDLIYNPTETLFLQKGKEQQTTIQNGLSMLELQADRAWEIWNERYVK